MKKYIKKNLDFQKIKNNIKIKLGFSKNKK